MSKYHTAKLIVKRIFEHIVIIVENSKGNGDKEEKGSGNDKNQNGTGSKSSGSGSGNILTSVNQRGYFISRLSLPSSLGGNLISRI